MEWIMTKGREESKKRETKAGLLEKNSSKSGQSKIKNNSKKDPDDTPKISKEKAEERNDERPIH
jgi:hypothetical protein